MVAKFLLGPAGSGKTFRCLAEIREALRVKPEGPPLLLLAPKQSTFQLERALLAEQRISGYTRLRVFSFERLAEYVFETLGVPQPGSLNAEGRLMVLRGIIAHRRNELKLYRASTRLTGFADQLALSIDELQQNQVTPEQLRASANHVRSEGLALKLQDLATLLEGYVEWQTTHNLLDENAVLTAAVAAIRKSSEATLLGEALWADGFADLSSQEARFIAAAASRCATTTTTFCLEKAPTREKPNWLSIWDTVERSYNRCLKEFLAYSVQSPEIEVLSSRPDGRFRGNEVLRHLQENWATGASYAGKAEIAQSIRLLTCSDPEVEVREAAREIVRFVRNGGRYREATVLVRNLPAYYDLFRKIFQQYEIPCFIDRRENVSHHPLAEVTRSALRTVVLDWEPEDWFAAIKSGLLPVADTDIDRLENEALAGGWRGEKWRKPELLSANGDQAWVNEILGKIMPPFERLRAALGGAGTFVTGPRLAQAIREFLSDLKVEQTLQEWAKSTLQGQVSGEAHLTVLNQVYAWLENLKLAFPEDRLTCREWLPILEAGLSRLTVGLIPPVLDQVLAGTIDRSRNVESKLVIALGINETVFPAQAEQSVLLTESDRYALEELELAPGWTSRHHAGRERHLAYLAFTRATERLVVSNCLHDLDGVGLNPSPFVTHLSGLFPGLQPETVSELNCREPEHPHELVLPVLQALRSGAEFDPGSLRERSPGLSNQIERVLATIQPMSRALEPEKINPELASRLYGPILRTSVSRLEQFAACPFRFFVHSGLDAKERTMFELDARERGNFQHEVLAEFHNRASRNGKRWRDLTPKDARKLVRTIAVELSAGYRDGLLFKDETAEFSTTLVTEALEDFVETMVEWMHSQYQFDPAAAELGFGEGERCPPWELPLARGAMLQLQGRIDRIDLYRVDSDGDGLCVVIDYKSSPKKLDPAFIQHGIQLQLLSYLNVMRRVPKLKDLFGLRNLDPAGVFYVSLRGKYAGEKNRSEALAGTAQERKMAYRHSGRFDVTFLPYLDSRGEKSGDQIPYRLKNDGQPYSKSTEALDTGSFTELLNQVEFNLKEMGNRIYEGETAIAPYRKGPETACDHCDYRSVCRSDPWTQQYRSLKKADI